MTVDNPLPDRIPTRAAQEVAARHLLRTAVKGSLATLDHETGHPYVSLVLVAAEPDATPVFLLSFLARHAKNLQEDPRASLLLDGTGGLAEPLTGDRVTVFGEVLPTSSPTARPRFLARHLSASDYVDFRDFGFYALRPSKGHFIGGFGRIFTLEPGALLTSLEGAQGLVDAEADILAHMNSDHKDAVALYATELGKQPGGDWRMCGIDPEGADLLHRTNSARIDFPSRVRSPTEARQTLVALVQQARALQQARA